jgi:hypothetical protein
MPKARQTLKTPTGIVRYANVFTARQRKDDKGQPKGDPKFSLLLVFDKKADLSEMEQEIIDKATEKFGSKASQMLDKGKLRSPIRDADEYVDEELDDEDNFPFNLPGARMVRFSTKDKPGVVDSEAEPIMDKSDFYDGCKARVSYRVYAYDREGNKGVGIALINVQKLEDGDRLGGSDPSAEDDFASAKPAKRGKSATAKRGRSDDDDDMV